jgi:hypothetical protein
VLDVEIAINRDALATWTRQLASILFVPDGKDEQQAVGQISQHVLGKYARAYADPFLAKADPWVIAHALVNNGIIVTQERREAPSYPKPKIPNVADYFGVKSVDTFEFLDRLGVKLIV